MQLSSTVCGTDLFEVRRCRNRSQTVTARTPMTATGKVEMAAMTSHDR